MQIKVPSDIKSIYNINDEMFLHITQFCNTDAGALYEINALLYSIKIGEYSNIQKINLNTFLKRQGDFCVLYKEIDMQIEFIDIKRN